MVVVLFLGANLIGPQTQDQVRIPYSEFLANVTNKEVYKVEIQADRTHARAFFNEGASPR